MKPSDAYACMAHREIERVEIDNLEGRVTSVLLTPYPPGIPLLIPGERFNRTIVEYLQVRAELQRAVPRFRHRHPRARRGNRRRPRPLFHGLRPSALTSSPARGDGSAHAWSAPRVSFLDWPRMTRIRSAAISLQVSTMSLVAIPAIACLRAASPAFRRFTVSMRHSFRRSSGFCSGSSPILATGPVAMTSLLTAASVGALAPAGTEPVLRPPGSCWRCCRDCSSSRSLARAGMLPSLVSHPVLMGSHQCRRR